MEFFNDYIVSGDAGNGMRYCCHKEQFENNDKIIRDPINLDDAITICTFTNDEYQVCKIIPCTDCKSRFKQYTCTNCKDITWSNTTDKPFNNTFNNRYCHSCLLNTIVNGNIYHSIAPTIQNNINNINSIKQQIHNQESDIIHKQSSIERDQYNKQQTSQQISQHTISQIENLSDTIGYLNDKFDSKYINLQQQISDQYEEIRYLRKMVKTLIAIPIFSIIYKIAMA